MSPFLNVNAETGFIANVDERTVEKLVKVKIDQKMRLRCSLTVQGGEASVQNWFSLFENKKKRSQSIRGF